MPDQPRIPNQLTHQFCLLIVTKILNIKREKSFFKLLKD